MTDVLEELAEESVDFGVQPLRFHEWSAAVDAAKESIERELRR